MKCLFLIYIITAMIIGTLPLKAQEGIVKYKHILNLDTTQPTKSNPSIPAFLYFNESKSLYTYNRLKDEKVSESAEDQLGKGSMLVNIQERDEYGDMFYTDFTRNKLMTRQLVWNEAFIAEEPLPVIHWNILTDNKRIGNYSCQKATTNFRGRDYEAWFTTEIAISSGPWKLHGLPGLILEASDKNKEVQFLFDAITIPGMVDNDLMAPQKGTRIPFNEFKNIEKTQSQKAIKLLQASMEKGTDADVRIDVYPIEKKYD